MGLKTNKNNEKNNSKNLNPKKQKKEKRHMGEIKVADIVMFTILGVSIAIAALCVIGRISYINSYAPPEVNVSNQDAQRINSFMNQKEDSKYMELVKKHDKDLLSVQKVDYPLERPDPLTPILDSQSENTGTVVTKFLVDLRASLAAYHSATGSFPYDEILFDEDKESNQIDITELDMDIKDSTVGTFTYKVKENASAQDGFEIQVFDSEKNRYTPEHLDMGKFKIIELKEVAKRPQVLLAYDNRTILLSLGEEYMNIKFYRANFTEGSIMLKDTTLPRMSQNSIYEIRKR